MRSVGKHIAVVQHGRLRLDEPTDLPENSRVPLFDIDPNSDTFDLDDDSRAKLEAALDSGWDELEAGRGISLEESMRRLSSR